jgi:hypothetical protein
MQKPPGYDNIPAITFEQRDPPAGGHVFKVYGVELLNPDTEKEQLSLKLDIEEGPFTNHFSRQSDQVGADRLLRIRQETRGEKTKPYFKGLITSFEESNNLYKWDWVERNLLYKVIGGNLRYHEYLTQSQFIILLPGIAHTCSVQTVHEGKIKALPVRKLKQSS